MDRIKSRISLTTISLASFACLGLLGVSTVVRADGIKPPVDDAPGGLSPGGSRNPDCLGQQSLLAMASNSPMALTTQAYPTFMFYVPQTTATTAVFVLRDENKKQVYKTTLALPKKPGVTSLSLPTTAIAQGLEVGKEYRWIFSVICDAQASDRSGDAFIEGKIKRVLPGIANHRES